MGKLLYEDLSYQIIGAAKDVYAELGPGFLESVYEDAFCYELEQRRIVYERQVWLDVYYKDTVFKNRFRADVLVENKIVVDCKALKELTNGDQAQLLNYLKVTKLRLGFLFNFGGASFEMMRRIW